MGPQLGPSGDRRGHGQLSDPDRAAQFRYLNEQARTHLGAGQPLVSVDTKKKEPVARFADGGRELRPAGEPEQVNVHDFPDPQLGKAIPYRVYDLGANSGWVGVGTGHDTVAFASARRVSWVMVDNGSSHRGQASVDPLQGAWPNLTLIHLPIHASWLTRLIEIYFSIVQRKVLTPNDFTDLAEVEQRLRGFQRRYEQTAGPFDWRYTRADLDRLLQRLDDHQHLGTAA